MAIFRLTQIFPILSMLLLMALLCGCGRSESIPDTAEEQPPTMVERVSRSWTADLEETLEKRRFLRVLVTYNQTNFFIDQGTPRGIEYDYLKRYEDFLNRQRGKKALRVKMVFQVMPFDQLIPALLDGRGDIIAAGLTITSERSQRIAFTRPYIEDVSEIVVSTKAAGDTLASVDDLAGRRVHVLAGSSYAAHLRQLNRTSPGRLFRAIRVIEADPHLEEEDLLQLVNAGIFESTVVDAHIAEVWANVLDNIAVYPNIAVNSEGDIAWAVRKGNPQLLASLNDFLNKHRQGTFAGNMLIKRYYENTRWIRNPLTDTERDRFESLQDLFQKYGGQYGFDWLKLAALAYQESRLNQDAKSHRGAVGIMQLLPRTAAGPNIRIPDISSVENNIHAGVKYLAYLRDTYFDDPRLTPEVRTDFAIAAYNAGPARIKSMRGRAAALGLDPDVWFNQVEFATRKFVGREPVQYVSNIYAYYIAYRTAYRVMAQKPGTNGDDGNGHEFLRESRNR
ncbi:MAG: transporter substrate-binding domain-containing protein [Desulfatitalea sp.]|nr:transporter substrate-binding domain-containing protein [Desulfatitalea sp.]NNK00917.1 transporter substrate-binding domain-containing protein [Desulfatitalea sp.]